MQEFTGKGKLDTDYIRELKRQSDEQDLVVLYSRYKDMTAEMLDKNPMNYLKLLDFARSLKLKYADALDYWMYHIASGGTPGTYVSELDKVLSSFPTKWDFPGEDSIMAKIEELMKPGDIIPFSLPRT